MSTPKTQALQNIGIHPKQQAVGNNTSGGSSSTSQTSKKTKANDSLQQNNKKQKTVNQPSAKALTSPPAPALPTNPAQRNLVFTYKADHATQVKPQVGILDYLQKADSEGTYRLWTISGGREKLAIGALQIKPKKLQMISREEDKAINTLPQTKIRGATNDLDITWGIDANSEFGIFVTKLKAASFSTRYQKVRESSDFKMLYPVEQQSFGYASRPAKKQSSLPCGDCGIYLPLSYLQIDHTRPQNKDKEKSTNNSSSSSNYGQKENRKEAIAKLFRTFGMTQAEPRGPKNRELKRKYGKISTFDPQQKLNPAGTKKSSVANDRASTVARYSLTPEGTLVYSVFRALGYMEVLELRCMNSLTNLRPLCSVCNLKRQNPMLTELPNWGEEGLSDLKAQNIREHSAGVRQAVAEMKKQKQQAGLTDQDKEAIDDQIETWKKEIPKTAELWADFA